MQRVCTSNMFDQFLRNQSDRRARANRMGVSVSQRHVITVATGARRSVWTADILEGSRGSPRLWVGCAGPLGPQRRCVSMKVCFKVEMNPGETFFSCLIWSLGLKRKSGSFDGLLTLENSWQTVSRADRRLSVRVQAYPSKMFCSSVFN